MTIGLLYAQIYLGFDEWDRRVFRGDGTSRWGKVPKGVRVILEVLVWGEVLAWVIGIIVEGVKKRMARNTSICSMAALDSILTSWRTSLR